MMTTTARVETGTAAITRAFGHARAEGRCALITYLTAGWPSPETTPDLVAALQAGGADIIELGVPFSDPVADGPTIQRASHVALQAGITPRACLEAVARLREAGLSVPLLLMGYVNPILTYGLRDWATDCAEVGVDGLIVPDLPPEEALPLRAECEKRGLALVFLVAPTTPPARVARIAGETRGFLYVVSRLGTTGAEVTLDDGLKGQLAAARQYARTPVAVGFGISQPEQVRALASLADGIIVGSAVVEKATEGSTALRDYVASLRAATQV
jgi:tryptophan synthase alpha chain